jgi:hypothetical protein
MQSITRFITQKLKLKVNEAKSAVARPEQCRATGGGAGGAKGGDREERWRLGIFSMIASTIDILSTPIERFILIAAKLAKIPHHSMNTSRWLDMMTTAA